jgi:hypothetical protein
MADGSTYRIAGFGTGPARLAQATQARSSLWAVCRCGREAHVDPSPWIGQGLSRAPVEALEARLRCLCGARSVKLEVRGLAEAPAGLTGGVYVFR